MQPPLGLLPRTVLYLPSTHCNMWQALSYHTRTCNTRCHVLTCVAWLRNGFRLNVLTLHSNYWTIQDTGHRQFSGLSRSASVSGPRADTLEPGKMDAPHTVRQDIPPSKAIDRTNIKESPSSAPRSPPVCQSTPSWPPDSRSSPHTSGHIKHSEATAAGTWDDTHADACAHTHAHTHTDVQM